MNSLVNIYNCSTQGKRSSFCQFNNDSSKFFLNLLKAVVLKTEYTGPRIKIDGYEIGGKTGTSELLNPKGGYYKDRNLTSFIGIFPN